MLVLFTWTKQATVQGARSGLYGGMLQELKVEFLKGVNSVGSSVRTGIVVQQRNTFWQPVSFICFKSQTLVCHTASHCREHCSLLNTFRASVPVVALVSPKKTQAKAFLRLDAFWTFSWRANENVSIPHSGVCSRAHNGGSTFHLPWRFFLSEKWSPSAAQWSKSCLQMLQYFSLSKSVNCSGTQHVQTLWQASLLWIISLADPRLLCCVCATSLIFWRRN